MRGGKGFTMLEIVLTITLMGVMAYVMVSAFSFSPTELALAEERLSGDIRLAQVLAMTRGLRHGIFFEPQAQRYTVFAGTVVTPIADPHDPSHTLIVNLASDSTFAGVTLTSASFSGGTTLTFDARGTPQDGNGVALAATGNVVLSAGSGSKTITISPETGKVTAP